MDEQKSGVQMLAVGAMAGLAGMIVASIFWSRYVPIKKRDFECETILVNVQNYMTLRARLEKDPGGAKAQTELLFWTNLHELNARAKSDSAGRKLIKDELARVSAWREQNQDLFLGANLSDEIKITNALLHNEAMAQAR